MDLTILSYDFDILLIYWIDSCVMLLFQLYESLLSFILEKNKENLEFLNCRENFQLYKNCFRTSIFDKFDAFCSQWTNKENFQVSLKREINQLFQFACMRLDQMITKRIHMASILLSSSTPFHAIVGMEIISFHFF